MARRTFFSFHYQNDIWRVWNVKNSWIVTGSREAYGFLMEVLLRKRKENLKSLLNDILERG